MDGAMKLCSARRIPKPELDRATACLANAEYEAARIIASAEAEAQAAQQEVDECSVALEARIAAAEESDYRAFVDQEKIKQRAIGAIELLDVAASIRAEFDEITPWLTDLVETCLRRIIGQLDPAEALAATLAQAVAELKTKSGLALRVAAVDHDAVKALIAQHPDRFAAVATVLPDAGLTPGIVYLEGKGGYASIGIEAQISALRPHLASLVKEAARVE